jgi:tetratricopeptide (TPR) repeat protein
MSYFRLGGEMWAQGKLEDAERLVRKALDFNPMSSNFSSDLGGILREQGRHEEAFAAVERSIALNPGMIQNYVKLASWSEGQPVEVIGYLRKAFDLDPANGYLASRISMAYAGLRASEETLAWAKHATALSPTNTWAWVLSMISLFSIGEHELAFQYADRALELDPGKRIVLRERGWREIEAGQTRLALQRWQEAYPLLTDRQNPQLVAGTAYAAVDFASNLVAAGEREWAQQVLNSGLDALEDFPLYLQWAYVLLGQKEAALEAIRHQVVELGDHRDAWVYDRPEYDYLRDDPGFQQIMSQIDRPDPAAALERVREMERNGELPPAPGVVIEP